MAICLHKLLSNVNKLITFKFSDRFLLCDVCKTFLLKNLRKLQCFKVGPDFWCTLCVTCECNFNKYCHTTGSSDLLFVVKVGLIAVCLCCIWCFSTSVCLQLLDKEWQLKLLHCTIKNSLAVAYPPSLSYSRAFLKSLITQVSFSLFILFVVGNFCWAHLFNRCLMTCSVYLLNCARVHVKCNFNFLC